MNPSLTPQQDAFARGVAGGKSQTEAYRDAYPRSRNWKPSAIWSEAARMMDRPKVLARVAELAKAVDAEFTVRTASLLREAACVAFSDVRRIIGSDGKVLLPSELDADTARAVAWFKVDEFGRIEYKFWDKNSALERLFKHKGLFERDNSQKVDPFADLAKLVSGRVLGVAAEPEGDAVPFSTGP